MMEAKDTVMSGEKIEEAMNIEVTHHQLERHAVFDGLSRYKLVALAQAEISFKAEIKEVVEWIKDNSIFTQKALDGQVWITKEQWQAKLEEWGIE